MSTTATKPTISKRLLAVILKQYETNERHNHHTDNVTLLAAHFGNARQKQVAKVFADVSELLGYQTSDADLREKHESVRRGLEGAFRNALDAARL